MNEIILSFIVGVVISAFFFWVISRLGTLKKFFWTRRLSEEIITPKEMHRMFTKEKRRQLTNEIITPKEMHRISVILNKEKGRQLARELKLSNERIEEIETNWELNSFGESTVIFDILEEWKNKHGDEATKSVVKKALIQVGEKEVATEVFSNEIITAKEMHRISVTLNKGKRRQLARELNLSNDRTEEIENNCKVNSFGESTVIFDILEEWKTKNGDEATRSVVKNALIQVGEKDVANEVFSTTMKKSKICIVKKNKPDIKKEENLPTLNENPTTDTMKRSKLLIEEENKHDTKMEENLSTLKENLPRVECVTRKEMYDISTKLRVENLTYLCLQLKITNETKDAIERECCRKNLPFKDLVYGILCKWEEINGKEAKRDVLKRALISSERKDIADEVLTNLPENTNPQKTKAQYKEMQQQIEEKQRIRCIKVELPQVNWTDKILPLEELYVNLELVKNTDEYNDRKGQSMALEEMFHNNDGSHPVRILVEGGPGYGKTTLCLKLLNDWGRKKDYIFTKFRMIFLFALRYFEQNYSIEMMLKKELDSIGVNGDEGINCIKAFENETLLLLDGFDEITDGCKRKLLPLLHQSIFPSMVVLITSRREMFELVNKKEIQVGGYFEGIQDNVGAIHVWRRRVLIKGVTTDKVEKFLRIYLKKEYDDLEWKINSIIKGAMREVFECPLFLILLAILLEENTLENVNSKTKLFTEFFNFIIKRNLIREKIKISKEKVINIFNESEHVEVIALLNNFGQLAVKNLYENDLSFEENDVLTVCKDVSKDVSKDVCKDESKDKLIFQLGFLMKIPAIQRHHRENLYQPIHKSFLEFIAAFAMFNLFLKDENEFKREIGEIANKGLKPTNDSLFYVFLGGMMNRDAHVLFQCLTRYRLWFNIESLCFTNILLEIKDISSFFFSFQPILDAFIPSLYNIYGAKGVTKEYFQSEIHSLVLKHASDRQLINTLWWNSNFPIHLSDEVHFKYIKLNLSNELFKIDSNEDKNLIKCQDIICQFSPHSEINYWNGFVSFLRSIQSEKMHMELGSLSNENNSLVLDLLHGELMEGQWKEKNVDRLNFNFNEFDDPKSLSLLVDLVTQNRINEGIYLSIHNTDRRNQQENYFLKKATEELFNAVIESKFIQEFVVFNRNPNDYQFNFNRVLNLQLKSLYFLGSLNIVNSNQREKEKYSVDEVRVLCSNDTKNINFIQHTERVKCLNCALICINSLVENEWSGLKHVEELQLVNLDRKSLRLLNSVLKLTNLQVLSLNVGFIKTIPSKRTFISLFCSLHLRICEFFIIQNLEIFSFLSEVLMEGLKKKEEIANNSTIDSTDGKKVQLHELVIHFDDIQVGFKQLKESNGIKNIRSMLKNIYLQHFCWVDTLDSIGLEEFEWMFLSDDKFRIFHEVDGMNPNSSRWRQFYYRWFRLTGRFRVKFIDE